jgi:ankyrin repeat protein
LESGKLRKVEKNMTVGTRYPILIFLFGLVFVSGIAAAPLHQAVLSGDVAQFHALVTPENINEKDDSGMTAIQLAVRESNIEIMKILIVNGADVNIAVTRAKFTPLHIAAYGNKAEMANLLITNGADVNQLNKDGATPLHFAVRRGNTEIAALLIANGADVNATDFEDYTPLHNAAWNGHLGVVEMLVNNGADINLASYDGRTPYRCAINGKKPEVAAFLEKLGALK